VKSRVYLICREGRDKRDSQEPNMFKLLMCVWTVRCLLAEVSDSEGM